MDAPEVIPAVPEHDGSAVVLPLIAEAIREASEPAKFHPKRKVAAFHDGRTNAVRVGLTHNWDYLHALDLGRAVAALPLTRGPVEP